MQSRADQLFAQRTGILSKYLQQIQACRTATQHVDAQSLWLAVERYLR